MAKLPTAALTPAAPEHASPAHGLHVEAAAAVGWQPARGPAPSSPATLHCPPRALHPTCMCGASALSGCSRSSSRGLAASRSLNAAPSTPNDRRCASNGTSPVCTSTPNAAGHLHQRWRGCVDGGPVVLCLGCSGHVLLAEHPATPARVQASPLSPHRVNHRGAKDQKQWHRFMAALLPHTPCEY